MATLHKKTTALDPAAVRAEVAKPKYQARQEEARRMTEAIRANSVVSPEKMALVVGR